MGDFFCAVCSAPSDVAKEMMARVARAAAESLIIILLVVFPHVYKIWPPDRKRSEVISYTNSSQRRELRFDEEIVRIDGNSKVIRSEGENIPETFRQVFDS